MGPYGMGRQCLIAGASGLTLRELEKRKKEKCGLRAAGLLV